MHWCSKQKQHGTSSSGYCGRWVKVGSIQCSAAVCSLSMPGSSRNCPQIEDECVCVLASVVSRIFCNLNLGAFLADLRPSLGISGLHDARGTRAPLFPALPPPTGFHLATLPSPFSPEKKASLTVVIKAAVPPSPRSQFESVMVMRSKQQQQGPHVWFGSLSAVAVVLVVVLAAAAAEAGPSYALEGDSGRGNKKMFLHLGALSGVDVCSFHGLVRPQFGEGVSGPGEEKVSRNKKVKENLNALSFVSTEQ